MKRLILVLVLLAAQQCLADGMIVPIEPRRLPHSPQFMRDVPMPEIRVHKVTAEIEGGVARTEVDQVFYNNHSRSIEGMYIFPLPPGAGVSAFSMFIDGEEVEGELLDRDEAGRIYEEIVRKRLDPAILEYMGTNIFKARVFPFEAHSEKRILISYDMVMERSGTTFEYVYPLSTEQFSPVPIEEVLVEATIKSDDPISNIFSPTHDVEVSSPNELTYVVTYEASGVTPDIDFQVFFDVPEEDLGFNLLPYREKAEDGFFVALISPTYEAAEDLRVPREVVFILDTSGSMKGEKLEQAKEALSYCLDRIDEDEKFGLVSFSSTVKTFSEKLVSADRDQRAEARGFIEALRGVGGTNIAGALEEGLSLFGSSDALKIAVFITDGLPTVGTTDIGGILEKASESNRLGVRIFSFGVGYDVNTHLLDLLSRENRALSEYVRPQENVEYRISHFFETLSLPLVTDVDVAMDGVKTYDVFPRQLTDMFKNTQMLLAGRYTSAGQMVLKLSGKRGPDEVEYIFHASLPEAETKRDFVARLWASQKIGYLLDEVRLHGEDPELIEEIVYLSKKYGVMTPYTSFLVREDVEYALDEASQRATNHMYQSFGHQTGKSAVDDAMASRVLSSVKGGRSFSVEALPEDEQAEIEGRMEYVGGKAFYLKKDRWYDSEYDSSLEEIRIKSFSDAYFALIRRCPVLTSHLSLGRNVTVRLGNVALSFGDEGLSDAAHPEIERAVTLCGTS